MKWYEVYYIGTSAAIAGTGATIAMNWYNTYPLSAWIGGGMSLVLSIGALWDLRAMKRRHNLP